MWFTKQHGQSAVGESFGNLIGGEWISSPRIDVIGQDAGNALRPM
jgi:hypothetical protein